MKTRRLHKHGFTLVEIIVVLVILAILAALLIPAMVGWIDKANEKSAIVGCRTCVVAAQTLSSEQYGVLGAGNINVTPDQVLALAKVDGQVSGIEINQTNAVLLHLTYTDPKGIVVLYCNSAPGCHGETYTFNGGGGGADNAARQQAFDSLAELFAKVRNKELTTSSGMEFYVGWDIDGVNSGTKNTFAKAMFDSMTPEVQTFLSSVSWSIVGDSARKNFQLYFTPDNHGTDSVSPVKVYRYDMVTKQYQYALDGVVDNGMVRSAGTNWSEWSNTMD